jgi:hypothetical protein
MYHYLPLNILNAMCGFLSIDLKLINIWNNNGILIIMYNYLLLTILNAMCGFLRIDLKLINIWNDIKCKVSFQIIDLQYNIFSRR